MDNLSTPMVQCLQMACGARRHNPHHGRFIPNRKATAEALVKRGLAEVQKDSGGYPIYVLSKKGWEYCWWAGWMQGAVVGYDTYADMLEYQYIATGGEPWLVVCVNAHLNVFISEDFFNV